MQQNLQLESPNLPRPLLMLLGLVQLIGALVDMEGRLLGMELDPLDRLALLHHQRLNAHEQSVDLLDGLLQTAQLIEPIHQIAQRLSFLLRLLQELGKRNQDNRKFGLLFKKVQALPFQTRNGTKKTKWLLEDIYFNGDLRLFLYKDIPKGQQ